MWMVAPIHCRKLHFKKRKKIMKMNFKQNSTKLAFGAGILVGLAGFSVPVFATSVDTTMQVTAGIGKNCVIETTNISFGSYDPANVNATDPLDATGSITTTCTIGTAGEVLINYGANVAAESTDRRMIGTDTSVYLGYEVYSNSDRQSIWSGEANNGVDITAAGVGEEMTVYARIPGGQTDAANDSYTDTLTVLVSY
jgi:spore coat protein U-like protein